VEKFVGNKLRSATLERLDAYNGKRASGQNDASLGNTPSGDYDPRLERVRDPLDFERGYQAEGALKTLKSVADGLANVAGRRKAIVYDNRWFYRPRIQILTATLPFVMSWNTDNVYRNIGPTAMPTPSGKRA